MRRATVAKVTAAVALAGLLVVDLAVLIHPEQLRRRLERAAEEAFSAEVKLDGARLTAPTRLSVDHALVVSRDRSDGGTLELAATDLKMKLGGLALATGRFRVEQVTAREVRTNPRQLLRLLEMMQHQHRVDASTATHPRVSIDRLLLDDRDMPMPLLSTQGADPIEFERVRLAPQVGSNRYWRIELSYRPAVLERVSLGGRVDLEQGTIELTLRASNLDLERHAPARLPDRLQRLLERLRPSGPFDLTLTAVVPWERPDQFSLRGLIECYTLTLAPAELPYPVTNIRGRARFDNNSLRIESLSGVCGTAELLLHGAVRDLGRAQGIDLKLQAWNLPVEDLARLSALPQPDSSPDAPGFEGRASLILELRGEDDATFGDAAFACSLTLDGARLTSGAVTDLRGSIELAGPKVTRADERSGRFLLERAAVGGVALEQLAGRVTLAGSRLVITDLDAAVADGRLTGAVTFDLQTGETLSADATCRGAQLAPLLPGFLDPDVPGTLESGRLRITPGEGGASVEAEMRVTGLDPFEVPELGPLLQGLEENGIARTAVGSARLALRAPPSGLWHVSASAIGQDYDLGLELDHEPGSEALRGILAIVEPAEPGQRSHQTMFEVGGTRAEPTLAPRN